MTLNKGGGLSLLFFASSTVPSFDRFAIRSKNNAGSSQYQPAITQSMPFIAVRQNAAEKIFQQIVAADPCCSQYVIVKHVCKCNGCLRQIQSLASLSFPRYRIFQLNQKPRKLELDITKSPGLTMLCNARIRLFCVCSPSGSQVEMSYCCVVVQA